MAAEQHTNSSSLWSTACYKICYTWAQTLPLGRPRCWCQ